MLCSSYAVMQLVMLHVSYVKSVMSRYAARLGYACSVPVSKPALRDYILCFCEKMFCHEHPKLTLHTPQLSFT